MCQISEELILMANGKRNWGGGLLSTASLRWGKKIICSESQNKQKITLKFREVLLVRVSQNIRTLNWTSLWYLTISCLLSYQLFQSCINFALICYWFPVSNLWHWNVERKIWSPFVFFPFYYYYYLTIQLITVQILVGFVFRKCRNCKKLDNWLVQPSF